MEKPNDLELNDGVLGLERCLEEVRAAWPISVWLDNGESHQKKLAQLDQCWW